MSRPSSVNPSERLAEIEARVEAATEGEWQTAYWPTPEPHWWVGQQNPDVLSSKLGPQVTGPIPNEANAEFIAAARSDVPWLLEQVREALEEHEADWTAVNGRSNSSEAFEEIVARVETLIRESAHALIAGHADQTARLIVAHLAHTYGMRPSGADHDPEALADSGEAS